MYIIYYVYYTLCITCTRYTVTYVCVHSVLFINEVLQVTREFTEVQYAFVGNEQTLDVKAWRKNDGAAA